VSPQEGLEEDLKALAEKLQNQKLAWQSGPTHVRRVLQDLPIEEFNHVLVLSYSPDGDMQHADSLAMMTLLLLRNIADQRGVRLSVVSEIMDIRNRDLMASARVDDFIISDRLVSLALAQLAENKDLLEVFQDLFNPQGVEIYLKPVEDYIRIGQPVNFYTILEAAKRRNEVAVGYRILSEAHNPDRRDGVHLNPDKSRPISFVHGDRLIVLAERE
jgi:ion channel POLLUX/CASTOR